MEDSENLNRILAELRKISEHLKRTNTKDEHYLVNFYRDSLEFMTDENIKSFNLIRKLFNRQLQQSRSSYSEAHKV